MLKWHFSLCFGQASKAKTNTMVDQYSQVTLALLTVCKHFWISRSWTHYWPWKYEEAKVEKWVGEDIFGKCFFFPPHLHRVREECAPSHLKSQGDLPEFVPWSFRKKDMRLMLPSMKSGEYGWSFTCLQGHTGCKWDFYLQEAKGSMSQGTKWNP